MPPQTAYLPSNHKTRQLTVGIGQRVLEHGERLVAVEQKLSQHGDAFGLVGSFIGRSLWARLKWLAVGR